MERQTETGDKKRTRKCPFFIMQYTFSRSSKLIMFVFLSAWHFIKHKKVQLLAGLSDRISNTGILLYLISVIKRLLNRTCIFTAYCCAVSALRLHSLRYTILTPEPGLITYIRNGANRLLNNSPSSNEYRSRLLHYPKYKPPWYILR